MLNTNTAAESSAQYLLTNDAALLLGVSPQTIRNWERLGRLHAVRTARGVRLFSRLDVERLARERQAGAQLAARG